MHLLVLPRIGTGKATIGPDGKAVIDAIRPDFKGMPEFEGQRKWGQASSLEMGVTQGVLVYVAGVEEFAIEELLNRHKGGPLEVARVVGKCATHKEVAPMHEHMRRRSKSWAEFKAAMVELKAHHKSVKRWTRARVLERERILRRARHHGAIARLYHQPAMQEWVAAYRALAEQEERRERFRRSARMFTVESSDAFGHGGSNPIDGLDMDAAYGGSAHLWDLLTGACHVESGYALMENFALPTVVVDADMAVTDDMRSTVNGVNAQDDPGGACRVQDGQNYYYARQGNPVKLYKVVADTPTQLGSDGTNFAGWAGCQCEGTSISAVNDGAVDVGPVTDSTFADGRLGIATYGGYAQYYDYLGEIGGDPTPQYSWGGPYDLLTGAPITPIEATKLSGNDADNFREHDDSPDSLADWGLVMDPDTGEITGEPYLPIASLPASIEVWLVPSNVIDGDGDPYVLELNLAVGAPVLAYNEGRAWIHAGHGKTLVMPAEMTGGEVPAGGFTSVGTALPAGVTLNADTGAITVGPTAALGTTAGIIIRATNVTDIDEYTIKLVVLPHMPCGYHHLPPGTRIDETRIIGVAAWDPESGNVEVELTVGDDDPVTLTSKVFDPDEGVWIYGVAVNPADHPAGDLVVSATINAQNGDPRILADVTYRANGDGSLTPADKTKTCDFVNGNDATGDGSDGNPFKTAGRAASEIEDLTGDCTDGTVLMKNGDYDYIGGVTTGLSTPNGGWLEFRAAPGHSPRWTGELAGAAANLSIHTHGVAIYHTNITAGASGGRRLWVSGNTVCTGLGQIDETYVFFNSGSYPSGVYVTGDPVDYAGIAAGDVAALKTAAETKWVIFEETASFPFGTEIKRNWWARTTGKDTGVQYDHLVQNFIDNDIDAQASGFHADVVHLIPFGGDMNLLVENGIGTNNLAQPFFSRNGAEDPDDPDVNACFVNVSLRSATGVPWNSQWIKSSSNMSWDHCNLPNGAFLFTHDTGTPVEAHHSFIHIRRCVLSSKNFSQLGQSYEVDENHFGDSVFGTNCTAGGDETDWWTDSENDDYSVVADSDIASRLPSVTVTYDALNKERAAGGSIGSFATASEQTPPITPGEGKHTVLVGTRRPVACHGYGVPPLVPSVAG